LSDKFCKVKSLFERKHSARIGLVFRPCFLILGDSLLFEQYRSIFLQLAKHLNQQYSTHLAYLDISATKQKAFQKVFSSIYHLDEKKLFVKNFYQSKISVDRFDFSVQIIVIRRWFDDTVEFVNTEIEFDDKSLHEFKRNHQKFLIDIEANVKFFLTNRWQNAKKFTLPTIFNFDDRNEVITKSVQTTRIESIYFANILEYFHSYLESNSRQMELLVREKSNTSIIVMSFFLFEKTIEDIPCFFVQRSGYMLTYQFGIFLIPLLAFVWYSRQDVDTMNNRKQTRKSFSSPTHRQQANEYL